MASMHNIYSPLIYLLSLSLLSSIFIYIEYVLNIVKYYKIQIYIKIDKHQYDIYTNYIFIIFIYFVIYFYFLFL